MRTSFHWSLLLLSIIAYAACLPLLAFCLGAQSCHWTSWGVLTWGWIAMVGFPPPSHLIWLGNPTLLIAWVLIAIALLEASHESRVASGLKTAAVLASGLALIVAACFLLPVSIVANEGGVPNAVTSRRAGYWLWLGSMICAFASAMLLLVAADNSVRRELSE
jgi:hypothetical protein